MFRTGIALLAAVAFMGLPAAMGDNSFCDRMVPVLDATTSGRTLLVARHEVTNAAWKQCHVEGYCSYAATSLKGAGNFPVTDLNYFDVQEYLAWVNKKSGGGLRLPTLEEWRFINRSLAPVIQGPAFTDTRMAWAANYGREKPASGPVRAAGSFSTTSEGIADLDGNVWEWTSTCFSKRFGNDGNCPAFVAAGEHEAAMSVFIRNPASGGCATGTPPAHLGFRLVAGE